MSKYLRLSSVVFVLILLSGEAFSTTKVDNVSAVMLQGHCKEIDKGVLGAAFDSQRAEFCKGYFDGFFDSIVVIEKLSGKQFCLPEGLPRIKHTQILNAWIEKNPQLAPKTTASVAIFSALKTAFPCRKTFGVVK